jgi:hypothetical protein
MQPRGRSNDDQAEAKAKNPECALFIIWRGRRLPQCLRSASRWSCAIFRPESPPRSKPKHRRKPRLRPRRR